ncbi:MAG: hypothetical protein EXQ52_04155 [Bryobacterales bacterium]|nr:hypothetical protein [Bryobacterales bacterium]
MQLSRRDLFLTSPLLLTRAQAEVTPDIVQFRPELESLVALVERTPRDRCAEMAVEQLRKGVSYRQFMAALFLAGIRNVNPRPPGFALHCVFVIHAAHLLGLEAPADSRLLPLFYALDNFKTAQERDAAGATGDYTMRAIRGPVPDANRAAAELSAAMESWDMERGERAIVSLARNRTATEVFALLWQYGARDYRNIGHKAIFVANAYRTLQTIGWQHAEPVLRSVTLALLDFGKEQKLNGYAYDDQCYAGNLKRMDAFARLDANWTSDHADAAGARKVLKSIRESSPDEACAETANRIVKDKLSAATVWDAVHLASAELRMRATGGAALASVHSVTSANALHYAYSTASDQRTRFLLTLQGVGWMTQFRVAAGARPENLRAFAITDLDTSAKPPSLTDAIRHTVSKVNEAHYYKYLGALIEDIPLMSAEWQPHLLAALPFYTKTAADPEPPAMKRAREALRSL